MSEDSWIMRFRRDVLPYLISEFKPQLVLLFGSRVKGESGEDSDLDAIIVAESFSGIAFIRRMPLVMKKARFEKHVDYICYTPEEFSRLKLQSVIVQDALQYGVRVA